MSASDVIVQLPITSSSSRRSRGRRSSRRSARPGRGGARAAPRAAARASSRETTSAASAPASSASRSSSCVGILEPLDLGSAARSASAVSSVRSPSPSSRTRRGGIGATDVRRSGFGRQRGANAKSLPRMYGAEQRDIDQIAEYADSSIRQMVRTGSLAPIAGRTGSTSGSTHDRVGQPRQRDHGARRACSRSGLSGCSGVGARRAARVPVARGDRVPVLRDPDGRGGEHPQHAHRPHGGRACRVLLAGRLRPGRRPVSDRRRLHRRPRRWSPCRWPAQAASWLLRAAHPRPAPPR